MKRSELFSIITACLQSGNLARWAIDCMQIQTLIEKDAEVILTEVEKYMLPPRVKLDTLDIEDNSWEKE